MKKTTLNLFIILVLIALVWCLFFRTDAGCAKHKKVQFNFPDTASISSLFMADMSGHQVTLKRKTPRRWILNGSYEARKQEINTLLQTLAQMKIKNPVPERARENVSKSMATVNTKVELYDSDGDLIKSFYVGPPNEKMNGNFMKAEGSDDLYLVHIPGFDGQLGTRFFVEEAAWRDRTVFQVSPADFSSVTVLYPDKPDSSFMLVRNKRDSFKLLRPESNAQLISKIDQRTARTYASYFKQLKFEVLANEIDKRDSIINSTPYCTIAVEKQDGEKQTLILYYKPVDKRTKAQINESGEALPSDLDRWYGLVNEGRDFVIIQTFVFGKVLVGPRIFR